ncbi:MAG: alpha-amylase family glycosyl hydrolase, partial [Actinomycetota bacterium]|nr:alpha-amylase family glycosyl hydrolase [Actinomycetota bacterium]
MGYEVYLPSFADGSGDGLGDLSGVRDRLDHLQRLGVDLLWLTPFYVSPLRDQGYDIADHCAVDPRYGDLSEFDALLQDAHARGMRVLVDLVVNHTSDQHRW